MWAIGQYRAVLETERWKVIELGTLIFNPSIPRCSCSMSGS